MGGASPLTIERVLNESVPDIGFPEDRVIALGEWTLNTGVPVAATGAGIVGAAATATSLRCLAFNATADATDIIRWNGCLPGQFKQQFSAGPGEHRNPQIVLQVLCRVVDAASGANADLSLDAQVVWLNEGDTAVNTLGAVVPNVVGATDFADAAEEGFVWRTYNLTGAMSAAQLTALRNNAAFQILLGPNEAVGTSLTLEVLATRLRMVRHASINPYGYTGGYKAARV